MKIIILHGDDSIKSRERLKKFTDIAKERGWEVTYLDESEQTFQEVLSVSSLFGKDRFFIVRDIKKMGKRELEWLKRNYKNLSGNLIIFNEGYINVSILKNLPIDTKIEEYKLPVLLWNFLDSLKPGSSTRLISTLHKIVENKPIEFIFSLISRQIRDLYWVKRDPVSTGFPFWKINKLKSQTQYFSLEKLKTLIDSLSIIDYKVKTSKTNLLEELDLLIIKQLE